MREATKKKAAKVEKLLAAGVKVREACKRVGISDSTFYHFNKANGRAQATRLVRIKRAETPAAAGRIMVFVGTPSEVTEAMRGML